MTSDIHLDRVDGKEDGVELTKLFGSQATNTIYRAEITVDGANYNNSNIRALTLTDATQLASGLHYEALDVAAEGGVVRVDLYESTAETPSFAINVGFDGRHHVDTYESIGSIETSNGQSADFIAGNNFYGADADPMSFSDSEVPGLPTGQPG